MKLTKKEFKAWLELHKDEEVGLRAYASSCPIAKYVNDTQDASLASVGSWDVDYTSVINGRGYTKQLPDWASRFIRRLDYTTSFGRDMVVTGKKALEVLNET